MRCWSQAQGVLKILRRDHCLSLTLQGLYDNFLNMKLRDSSLSSVCLALEWLGFSDMLGRAVLHGQSFQLMRYLPFLPVAFHLLFAATSIPRLAYPSSQHEASTGRARWPWGSGPIAHGDACARGWS